MKKDCKVVPLGGVAFILCVVTTLTLAQPPDTLWTKTYGGINDDAASSVQQTSDDGYIIAGWTEYVTDNTGNTIEPIIVLMIYKDLFLELSMATP